MILYLWDLIWSQCSLYSLWLWTNRSTTTRLPPTTGSSASTTTSSAVATFWLVPSSLCLHEIMECWYRWRSDGCGLLTTLALLMKAIRKRSDDYIESATVCCLEERFEAPLSRWKRMSVLAFLTGMVVAFDVFLSMDKRSRRERWRSLWSKSQTQLHAWRRSSILCFSSLLVYIYTSLWILKRRIVDM